MRLPKSYVPEAASYNAESEYGAIPIERNRFLDACPIRILRTERLDKDDPGICLFTTHPTISSFPEARF